MLFQQLLKQVIIMKKNEKELQKSAKVALLSLLSNIPFIEVIEVQGPSNDAVDQLFDITIKIRMAEKVLNLIAEIKSSGQPRLAREAVNQMLRYRDKIPKAYFVFIAPYISPRAAGICESEGVGYFDLSGNCFLSFDSIFIQKSDYPNQFKEKRELKSLYKPKAERILRVLLCNPGKSWKIKELAFESGVSLGLASNVKKILFDRELISGERGGFSLKDPLTLLREWAEKYDYRKNVIHEFYSLKSVTDIEYSLADFCIARKIKYALTGFSGAARIEPAVRYKKAMAYVANIDEKATSDLSFKPVKSGGNLLLFSPYDEGLFYASAEVDGLRIASEIQIYLDVQGFRGRGEEAAEVLYERIADKAW